MNIEALLKEVICETSDDVVVVAAARLFLREGINQVKMTDIAELAGVGVATIYRHFQTKARLAAAAGTLMWQLINHQILAYVETDEFLSLTGIERLSCLFSQYSEAYATMPEFVAFLAAFDHLVLQELESDPELARDVVAYGEVIDSFYILFLDAYQLGCADGTISCSLDFRVFYQAMAHGLMGAAEKLSRGGIIPSDEADDARAEINCLVDTAVRSLKAPADNCLKKAA